jgi:hypothetical protein
LASKANSFDAGWSQLAKYTSNVVDASATTDMWHERMVMGMVPEGTVNINVGCELWQGPEADAGAVYFDNVGMMVSAGDQLSSDGNNVITPKEFALLNNYPNPFNPVTTLRFDLPEAGNLSVSIYDVKGKVVKELINTYVNKGRVQSRWSGKNEFDMMSPTGIYFLRVETSTNYHVQKLALVK